MQANAHKPRLRLISESFPDRPAFGTAVSEAILRRVAGGELEATARVHRPSRELAFSKQDAAASGFERAAEVARAAGYEPVVRLAGGRAAIFHEHSLAIAWASPDRWPARHTRRRFELMAGVVAAALVRVGVDARIGAVPGEYCPGTWSVNARGRTKLVGIGQRLISGAAHVGAVVVVAGEELVREVLVPVYRALELEWEPRTAGSVSAEVGSTSLDEVESALLAELAERFELRDAELDEATLELAGRLEQTHRVGGD